VREAVGAPQVIGRVGPEGGQRVLAFDASVIEVMRPAGADGQRAVALRTDHQEPHARMLAQGGHESRVVLVDPLQRHPSRLPGKGDQAQAA
jgi:hypothetical protein